MDCNSLGFAHWDGSLCMQAGGQAALRIGLVGNMEERHFNTLPGTFNSPWLQSVSYKRCQMQCQPHKLIRTAQKGLADCREFGSLAAPPILRRVFRSMWRIGEVAFSNSRSSSTLWVGWGIKVTEAPSL
eukprot:4904216-Amphidinium_carterae.1